MWHELVPNCSNPDVCALRAEACPAQFRFASLFASPRGAFRQGRVWSKAATHHQHDPKFAYGLVSCCANPPYTNCHGKGCPKRRLVSSRAWLHWRWQLITRRSTSAPHSILEPHLRSVRAHGSSTQSAYIRRIPAKFLALFCISSFWAEGFSFQADFLQPWNMTGDSRWIQKP